MAVRTEGRRARARAARSRGTDAGRAGSSRARARCLVESARSHDGRRPVWARRHATEHRAAVGRRRRGNRGRLGRHALQSRRPRRRHLLRRLARRLPDGCIARDGARRQLRRHAVRGRRHGCRRARLDPCASDVRGSRDTALCRSHGVGRPVQARRPRARRFRAARRHGRRVGVRPAARGRGRRQTDHHELERREARPCARARRVRHGELPLDPRVAERPCAS